MRAINPLERWLVAADRALRTVASPANAVRAMPESLEAEPLTPAEREEAGALMRVNHVGEICAQAMYDAQALAAHSPEVRDLFQQAADEESDHLAWTRVRIEELGSRPSLLNPLWYGGAFLIGLVAARTGDKGSLGFMAETERQVEQHLDRHLSRLPLADRRSRAIVERMKDEEAHHADTATQRGGTPLPAPVRWAMALAARVMTSTAHRI